MKVPTIVGNAGSRSLGAKAYSNNSALCVLDYLTNPDYGLGLSADKLDLDTFYNAAVICDTVVFPNAPKQGAFWDLKGGTRDVKLYECNIALDSAATIRDNLTIILETMNDANLIWSGGKYKLTLEYPSLYSSSKSYVPGNTVQQGLGLYRNELGCTNVSPLSDITQVNWVDAIAAYVTDDTIIRDAATSITWPNAQTRLNFATVRFNDESKDFKENTATWPVKTELLYSTYLSEDSGILLETEQFAAGITTSYAALARAEYLVRNSRSAITYEFSVCRDLFYLEPGDIIHLKSEVLGIPGDLVRVTEVDTDSEGSFKVTGVRFDANTLAWNVADNEDTYKRKIFNTTIEQANGLAFSNSSAALVDSGGVLTWNYPSDNRVLSFDILYAQGTIDANTVWYDLGKVRRGSGSQGSFNLPSMIYQDFAITVVSNTLKGIAPQSGWPVLSVVLGRISDPAPQVVRVRLYKKAATTPATPVGGLYNFAARTLTAYDAGWSLVVPSGVGDTWASDAVAASPTGASTSDLVWSTPSIYLAGNLEIKPISSILGVSQRPDTTLNYASAISRLTLWSGGVDVTNNVSATFAIEKTTSCVATINTNQGASKGEFWVSDLSADEGSFVIAASYNSATVRTTITVRLAGEGYVRDIRPPTAPTGISVSTTSTVVLITQTQPTYTVGRGHFYTEVWAKSGLNAADSTGAVKLDEFQGNFYTIPTLPGEQKTLFFKWISKDKGSSDFSTGVNSNALQIGETLIANGAITTDKIAVGAITAGSAIIQDGAITNAKIGNVIQSEGYVPGSGGWRIDKQGNVELNAAVFRGTLNVVGPGASRMEFNSNVLKVFNNNVLVVKIGDLSA
jgi:hypothetical protein